MTKNIIKSGFTIVELIVVISVIAILAAITIISYGAWRTQTATNSVKSDLVNAASAMESARTFASAYPLTIPSTFSASSGVTVNLAIPDTKTFCLNGTSAVSASIQYYIDNLTQINGATLGTCVGRILTSVPTQVTSVTSTTVSLTIQVNWTIASPNYATSYLAQCSIDPSFITGIISNTVSGATTATATVSGATVGTTYYCRVKASNSTTASDWSSTTTVNT